VQYPTTAAVLNHDSMCDATIVTLSPQTSPDRYETPCPEPIIGLKDADVLISFSPDGTNDILLPSSLLKQKSTYFRGALKDCWVTDEAAEPVNWFELGLDRDCEPALVRKVTGLHHTY